MHTKSLALLASAAVLCMASGTSAGVCWGKPDKTEKTTMTGCPNAADQCFGGTCGWKPGQRGGIGLCAPYNGGDQMQICNQNEACLIDSRTKEAYCARQ